MNSKIEIPFSNFKPFAYTKQILFRRCFSLCLKDEKIKISVINPECYSESAAPYADWTFIKLFMDSTKPLPDLPIFEPVRPKYAATKCYDENNSRPPRFWRDMEMEKAEKIIEDSRSKLMKFEFQRQHR